jgi:hypothetical protein
MSSASFILISYYTYQKDERAKSENVLKSVKYDTVPV